MFEKTSRYVKAETYTVRDHRGREVQVVAVPDAPLQQELGVHRVIEGQHLDHLANTYLKDAAGFWRFCELNDAMWADALAEASELRVPRKS